MNSIEYLYIRVPVIEKIGERKKDLKAKRKKTERKREEEKESFAHYPVKRNEINWEKRKKQRAERK